MLILENQTLLNLLRIDGGIKKYTIYVASHICTDTLTPYTDRQFNI